MRTLVLSSLLGLAWITPALAESARFIKVDIVSKNGGVVPPSCKSRAPKAPQTVKARFPIALAKGILEMAGTTEIKVNGENRPGMKPEALIELLERGQAGDLLLEITTSTGDHIRITLE